MLCHRPGTNSKREARLTSLQAKFAELERKEKEKSEVKEDVGFTSEEISPLSDFDWATVESLKFRPFKPKFHLTMGSLSLYYSFGLPLPFTLSFPLAIFSNSPFRLKQRSN
jgi:hypothetical protein